MLRKVLPRGLEQLFHFFLGEKMGSLRRGSGFAIMLGKTPGRVLHNQAVLDCVLKDPRDHGHQAVHPAGCLPLANLLQGDLPQRRPGDLIQTLAQLPGIVSAMSIFWAGVFSVLGVTAYHRGKLKRIEAGEPTNGSILSRVLPKPTSPKTS